jgi:hypothetical protein
MTDDEILRNAAFDVLELEERACQDLWVWGWCPGADRPLAVLPAASPGAELTARPAEPRAHLRLRVTREAAHVGLRINGEVSS